MYKTTRSPLSHFEAPGFTLLCPLGHAATYFSAKVVLTQLKKGAFFGELAVMFVALALLGLGVVVGSPMSEKTHHPFLLR